LLNETPLHCTEPAAASLPFSAIRFTIGRGYFGAAQHVVVYDEDVLCIFPVAVI
jgi:hypothetical protein